MIIILGLLVLSGCNTTTCAYFDMNESCCCNCKYDYKLIEKCNDICDNSGIRIRKYQHENEIIKKDGCFICKCY